MFRVRDICYQPDRTSEKALREIRRMYNALDALDLDDLRRELGFTQEEFAYAGRVSVSTLKDWMDNKREPTLSSLLAFLGSVIDFCMTPQNQDPPRKLRIRMRRRKVRRSWYRNEIDDPEKS